MKYLAFLILLAPSLFAADPVTINVDANANRHPISEMIYGAAFATAPQITDLGLTSNRWGGNASGSRCNWANSTTNRAADFFFENIPDNVSSGDGSNGKSADDFIGMTLGAGATPVMTLPLMGRLPFDRTIRCGYSVKKYGAQDDTDDNRVDCGNGKFNGQRMLKINDPNDTSAVFPSSHQAAWIAHMRATWGAASAGGVKFYSLDNEPALWSSSHWDIHPDGTSYNELRDKLVDYGTMIRNAEPNALITGPEEWGWDGYLYSGLDAENYGTPEFLADRQAHGNVSFSEYFLQQAKLYEQQNGPRILDYLTEHFYPQGGEFSNDVSAFMQALRDRSTRGLWDPNYVNESYIGETGFNDGIVRLIPLLKEWTSKHYPGTRTGVTEYNWGAENHINGATAQADILGIFGREGIDLGVRWTTPPTNSFAYNAMKIYRNYDGAHSKFGDVSIGANGPNPDLVAPFAAIRSTDGALTLMIVTKTIVGSSQATINLAGFNALIGGTVQRWQLTGANNAIVSSGNFTLGSSSFTITLQPQTITLLVIPPAPAGAAPANFSAIATSTSSASLTWNAVGNATGYEVFRSSDGAAFALIATVGTNSFTNNALSANTTYLYKVRATTAGGPTAFSNVDPATTVVFTDGTLDSTVTIKAAHMTQLRTAVNAMRVAAGVRSMTFTDPSLGAGTVAKSIHVSELRAGLDEARRAIGLPQLAYTDIPLTPRSTGIKAVQFTSLRAGVQ